MRAVLCAFVAIGALMVCGPTAAQGGGAPAPPTAADQERARELYENGAILYEEGRYEDAIAAWWEAHRLSQKPLLLFNIANAYERLGEWEQSLEVLQRYRAFAPAEERETLERRIRNMEARIAEAEQSAAAAEGAEAAEAAKVSDAAQAAEEKPASEEVVAEVAPAVAPASKPVGAYALAGVSVVAVGGGVYLGLKATEARAQAEAECVLADAGLYCGQGAEEPLMRADRLALGADALFGLAAVSATAAGLIWLRHQRGEPPEDHAWRVAPAVAPGYAGLVLTLGQPFGRTP